MILRLKMTLELHLGLRLGLQCKTKCVDWGYIRGYTFYMVLTTFTPLIMTKKNGLTPIFAVYPPRLFRIAGGIMPLLNGTNNWGNRVFTGLSGAYLGRFPRKKCACVPFPA